MPGQERSREWIAHPPESGVDHEVRRHHPEVSAEDQADRGREPVQMRRAAEQHSPHQGDVGEHGQPEPAGCPPASPRRDQSHQEQVLEPVGHGHAAHRGIGRPEGKDGQREQQRHQVHGAEPGRAVGGRAAGQGHHPGSRGDGEHQPRRGEQLPGSWPHPELEEIRMGEQPEDAGPSRPHQGPAFGPAQGPHPVDRGGQGRQAQVLLLEMKELPREVGQEKPGHGRRGQYGRGDRPGHDESGRDPDVPRRSRGHVRADVRKGVQPAGCGDVNRGAEEEQPGQTADRSSRRWGREDDGRAERARTEGHRAPEPGAGLTRR